MKRRLAVLICLLPLLALALAYPAGRIVTASYMDEAAIQGGTTLRLAVSALTGHLSRYRPLPALIADQAGIEALVSNPGDPALRQAANLYLKEINTLLESSDIYVITMDGETIAASNYDKAATFIGQNFSYRPYFQDAAEGRQSRFYALGTTSAKRGYYFGAPIVTGNERRGVIVFKIDIDSIETSWRGSESHIFVSDPEGIIFMTGSPEWLYSSILPLTTERLARTEASRRYSDAKLRELPIKRDTFREHDLVTVAGQDGKREYLSLSQYMPEADWTVNVMVDTASVHKQARTTVIAFILFLCLAGLALAILLQRRAQLAERLQMQAEAQNELERRVEERTADLARVNQRIEEEIAERRQTEQQLRRTQADLIQAGKLAGLGQMSAALSHELNQPLAAAKTYADSATVLIERNRTQEARDNIGRISSLIDRMASISRHLRNFARKPNEELGAVPLDDVLKDTQEIIAARLKAADAVLEVDLGAVSPVVKAGPIRLQQVLVNIISNAADAIEGQADRRIFLKAENVAGRVVVTIKDNGPGVPPAIAERIFDPFFTTKGVGKGLGLGLSISYNIIKDFGGNLAVSNHEGGGAVFRIELDKAEELHEAAE